MTPMSTINYLTIELVTIRTLNVPARQIGFKTEPSTISNIGTLHLQ
jgi:hypothetical protein